MTVAILSKPRKAVEAPYRVLGRRIAELRVEARLSQREMARRAHISEGYPSALEGGRSRPEPDVLRSIAGVLGADYDELAILAGYLAPRADEAIYARSDDQVAPIRRLLRFPAWVLDRLDRVGDALFYEDVPAPPAVPQEEAAEEGDEHAGPDAPHAGASHAG